MSADGVVIKATKLELSVWSDFFRTHLLSEKGHDELEIAQADSETVGTLVRSLYEKEVGS